MILPFKALRYNTEKIESLADVITPPYDVISSEMQAHYFDKSPFNFCRLDFPKQTGESRFEEAARCFKEWCRENILITEKKPALYVYRHTFYFLGGHKTERVGLFVASEVTDYSLKKIIPHEKTLTAPKQDRLKITEATQTNLSPIFALYQDPEHVVSALLTPILKNTPLFDFVDDEEKRHELWKIQDEKSVEKICHLLNDKPFFIADGHHRYETALQYLSDVKNQNQDLPQSAAPRFTLMYLCRAEDPGLVILPIHRAVQGLPDFNTQTFLNDLAKDFKVEIFEEGDFLSAFKKQESDQAIAHSFVMLAQNSKDIYRVSCTKVAFEEWARAKNIPQPLADLDVTVLHESIFSDKLNISPLDLANQTYVTYHKSTEAALFEWSEKKAQLVFFLNPTSVDQMLQVAYEGFTLPQKSTFFYPKVPSGLLLHSVNPNERDGF